MTTSFLSLPIVDLGKLSLNSKPSPEIAGQIGGELYDVFATTGFAYLVNTPLTFDHETVFNLTRSFFGLPTEEKMRLAKQTFQPQNTNTYRGYFPLQPLRAADNLKEGFEIGPIDGELACREARPLAAEKFNMAEPNVWPEKNFDCERRQLQQLYAELQGLASQLLSLLAVSLGKGPDYFNSYLKESVSTLRLLHYPKMAPTELGSSRSCESLRSSMSHHSDDSHSSVPVEDEKPVDLSCTPHTDSGILTLLHQDSTGGLEVRNSIGQWIAAPYIPGSIVVNIGDLMAEVSGGRFVATMHRVRKPSGVNQVYLPIDADDERRHQFGRFSVPFFFEPGEDCIVKSVDDDGAGHGILYAEHVRQKMQTWVEFQDQNSDDTESND